MIIMAGGIDIHSHIAGGNVNNARVLSLKYTQILLDKNLVIKKIFPGFNTRWTCEGQVRYVVFYGQLGTCRGSLVNSFCHLELEKNTYAICLF